MWSAKGAMFELFNVCRCKYYSLNFSLSTKNTFLCTVFRPHALVFITAQMFCLFIVIYNDFTYCYERRRCNLCWPMLCFSNKQTTNFLQPHLKTTEYECFILKRLCVQRTPADSLTPTCAWNVVKPKVIFSISKPHLWWHVEYTL